MKARSRSRGLTLVELLVAMSIGLVVVGAMAALYVRTSQSNRQLEALARLQENARYAFELLGYDIRMSGSTGCNPPLQQTLPTGTDPDQWWLRVDRPLYGQDETADSNTSGDSGFSKAAPGDYGPKALRGDTLIVLRANTEDNLGIVGNYKLGSTPIPFTDSSNTGFKKGRLLLLTDCKNQPLLLQKTDPDAPTAPIVYSILANYGALTTNDMTGARLAALSANAYYLRASPYKYPNSNQYIPALYRQTLGTDSGATATVAEELVSGVTDLQFQYGICTTDASGTCTHIDPTKKSAIASYQNASNMSSADWSKVLAVRVTITLESPDDSVRAESQSFTLGNGTTLSDRRLRRSYTMTFGIRNRLLGNLPPPSPPPPPTTSM